MHRRLICFVNRWSGVQISHPAPISSDTYIKPNIQTDCPGKHWGNVSRPGPDALPRAGPLDTGQPLNRTGEPREAANGHPIGALVSNRH
jgi:hypothetical protein